MQNYPLYETTNDPQRDINRLKLENESLKVKVAKLFDLVERWKNQYGRIVKQDMSTYRTRK